MTTSAPRPSALQMALLWETRLGKHAQPSHQRPIPLSPTPLTPPLSPPRSEGVIRFPSIPRRPRKSVSANKPPVAPILAPNPITPTAQEVQLPHPMLDVSSPVSSCHSSAPSSPPVQNLPHHRALHVPDLHAEIEQLHRDLAHCHQRMDTLEIRLRAISSGMRNVKVYNIIH
ncbi:hypothetical protein FGB62_92g045 [Gracilaria domingensis]|nr:hypothetical protein FGB62_92g045 [Gracilaria domingensis]